MSPSIETAAHEVGHAINSHASGGRVIALMNFGTSGHCWHVGAKDTPLDRGTILVGGWVAAEMLAPGSKAAKRDGTDLAKVLAIAATQPAGFIARCEDEARRIIRTNWCAFRELVGLSERAELLEEDAIHRILSKRHPPITHYLFVI